jgi:hypothetical protein
MTFGWPNVSGSTPHLRHLANGMAGGAPQPAAGCAPRKVAFRKCNTFKKSPQSSMVRDLFQPRCEGFATVGRDSFVGRRYAIVRTMRAGL